MADTVADFLPNVPSLGLTLAQWLSSRDGRASWGIYVDPVDTINLHCLSAIAEFPVLIVSPESPFGDERMLSRFKHFHWISQAAGYSSGCIDWHRYSDTRFNGRFGPASWPEKLQALRFIDSKTVSQQSLDCLICDWASSNDPQRCSQAGILLLESSDPLPILFGALTTLQNIEMIAWRPSTSVPPNGIEPFVSFASKVSPHDLLKTSDEWLCFERSSLQQLIVCLHLSHFDVYSKVDALDRRLFGEVQADVSSRFSREHALSPENSKPSLFTTLYACASADWKRLVALSHSLHGSRFDACNKLAIFASRLCSHSSELFNATRLEFPVSNEPLCSCSEKLLEDAFSILSGVCTQQSCGDSLAAIETAKHFVLLLLRASLSEGFSILSEERSALFDLAQVLPQRLLTQSRLKSLSVGQMLPTKMAFVLGMHRSGTSALTGLLYQAGYAIPNGQLLPANSGNPKGHWELQSIYSMNNRLLAENGSSWRKLTPFSLGWIDSAPSINWREQMLQFLSQSLPCHQISVLKDPRFSLLAPAMAPWFASGFIDPTFLVCLRHPAEVASSLMKRDGISILVSTRLWISYMLSACKICVDSPHAVIWYDRLISQPGSVLDLCSQVSQFCSGHHLESNSTHDFVDPKLRHHRISDALPEFYTSLQGHLLELRLSLSIFSILASSPTISPAGFRLLDQLDLEWETLSSNGPQKYLDADSDGVLSNQGDS